MSDFRAVADMARRRLRDQPSRSGNSNDGRPTRGQPRGRDEEEEEHGPIGVQDDFRFVGTRRGPYSARGGEQAAHWNGEDRTPGTIGERLPLYQAGDEDKPGNLHPNEIGELQATMAAVGLLGDNWRYGIWDEPSVAAYKALLGEANRMGITAEAALQQRAQSETFPGSGGGGSGEGGGGGGGHWGLDENGEPVWVADQYVPPPLEVRTTNKKDLARVFRAAVIDTMGEGWSQAQIDEVVNAYNWQEIKVQKDAYDQRVALERAEFEGTRSPAGGEVLLNASPDSVDIESPETFLENEMIRRDPEGYQAGRLVNEALPNFMAAIEGWV